LQAAIPSAKDLFAPGSSVVVPADGGYTAAEVCQLSMKAYHVYKQPLLVLFLCKCALCTAIFSLLEADYAGMLFALHAGCPAR